MAFRDRPAFDGVTTVNVRCPRCRKRLAEAWPETFATGPGWDGVVLAGEEGPPPLAEGLDAPERWRCGRCDAVHTVRADELHYHLRAVLSRGGHELTLGEKPADQPSRPW